MRRQLVAVFAVLFAVVFTACSNDSGGSSAGGGGSSGGGCGTMRFVFSPDPVWNWLEDQGIIAQMEQESDGCHIQRFESEDEFAFFAGGHADIVSTGSYETPVLESEAGVQTVTIGKYNMAKDIVVVAADKPWNSFGDLPKGCKVGEESFTGSSIVWQALAKDLDGRTLAQSSDDLQMVLADFDVGPGLVLKGDLCAATTSIYDSLTLLKDGKVKGLYDNKSASQLYADNYAPGHEGMNSNNFVVLKSWYDEHPEEVAFFLKVWQRGLDEWANNKEAILNAYPDDFGYKNADELAYLEDWYANQFDEFVDSVYLDQDWINGEAKVVDLLKGANLVSQDQPQPVHVCIDPSSGDQTCSIPSGA
jgi:hypothetical protein